MPLGYLFCLASAFSFACYIVLGKISEGHLEPITLVFYLSLLAWVISLPIAFLNTKKVDVSILKQEFFNSKLWIHVGCIFLAMWTLWQGVSELNPATATMIGRTETLWTVLLACFIYKERFSVVYCFAFILAIAGLLLMQGNMGEAMPISIFSNQGVLCILISSIFFAAAEVFAKNISQSIPPTRFSVYRHGIITVTSGVISLFLGQMHWPEQSEWLHITLAAMLGPGLARLLYMYALQRLELIKTTLLSEIEPVFTAIVSFLILREVPSTGEWTGGGLMLLSCLTLTISIYRIEKNKTTCLSTQT